jgi:hypothetical protein
MMTTAPEDHAQPATAPAASTPQEPTPTAPVAPPQTTAAAMSPEAIRAEAAEVAQVCAQAARLGIQIDAADAVAKGVKPEALRAKVLADLAARSDAAGVIATAPAAGTKESPIVAAAKKSAAALR